MHVEVSTHVYTVYMDTSLYFKEKCFQKYFWVQSIFNMRGLT